jgi:hypothetical protein
LICAGLWLAATPARAQSTDTFRGAAPFPGTVRDLLRDDLARTSGQLYGAIGVLERRGFLHMEPGQVLAVAETNIIAGALRIPGTSQYGVIGDTSYRGYYQLLPADVFAFSAAFGIRFEKLGLFASAGAVYPRVSDGTEAAIGRYGFGFVGVLGTPLAHLGVLAAPLLTGATRVVGSQSSADIISYLYGASYDFGPVALYAGLTGTGRGAGLYTNITQSRLRFLAESVLSESFSELSYLKAGINQLPGADRLLAGSAPEEDKPRETEDRGLTSLYGRKVLFSIPRRGADSVALDPDKLGFWSLHAEQANLGQIFDVALAAGVYPAPLLHEARVGLHTTSFYSRKEASIGISAGAVRLPALYMLAEPPGFRFAARVEARYGEMARMAFSRNEPELLSSFPYAYDAWAFYFSANPLVFFQK